MPIYAYQCATCGHDFDKLQKMSDPDPEVCPSCGVVGNVKRQLTAPSFRLAGSGWYETDFKKDGDKKRNLVEGKDASAPAESKSDGKAADSKPAAASESKPDAKPAGGSSTPDSKPATPKVEAKPAVKPKSGD